MSPKLAPRLRARAIGKSKSLKTGMIKKLFEVQVGKTCTTPARESDLEVKIVKKLAGPGRVLKLKSAKFAPRLRARAIWKSKSLKTGMIRTLFEVQVGKTCTTPSRESDLEGKIVKKLAGPGRVLKLKSAKFAPRLRARAIWKSKSEHFLKFKSPKLAPRCGARAIRKSKSLKHQGLGPLFEVQNAVRVAGARISTRCKVRGRRRSLRGLQKRWQAWWISRGSKIMLFAEGSQISRYGNATLQGSFRAAATGIRMPRLNFFAAGAVYEASA